MSCCSCVNDKLVSHGWLPLFPAPPKGTARPPGHRHRTCNRFFPSAPPAYIARAQRRCLHFSFSHFVAASAAFLFLNVLFSSSVVRNDPKHDSGDPPSFPPSGAANIWSATRALPDSEKQISDFGLTRDAHNKIFWDSNYNMRTAVCVCIALSFEFVTNTTHLSVHLCATIAPHLEAGPRGQAINAYPV